MPQVKEVGWEVRSEESPGCVQTGTRAHVLLAVLNALFNGILKTKDGANQSLRRCFAQ